MKNLIQKNIREIIPSSAVLVLRTYENKSGMVFSYRLRIRNQQQSKYQYLSLKATNERDAVLEAFEVYKDIADSLKRVGMGGRIGNIRSFFSQHFTFSHFNLFCSQTLDTGQHSNQSELAGINSQRSSKTEHLSSLVCERLSHFLPSGLLSHELIALRVASTHLSTALISSLELR